MEQKFTTSRIVTEAARNQFDSCYAMLQTLVDVCPKAIWQEVFSGVPFWYQVYHVAYFVDYWFREVYNEDEFRSMRFDDRIPPEFETEIDPALIISQQDMKEYLRRIHVKTTRIFDHLNDEGLALPIVPGQEDHTYTDIILSQIRHIMYNIGYLNGILRSRRSQESDWYAYNENEDLSYTYYN